MSRQDWVAIPMAWLVSPSWHQLRKREMKLLLDLWANAPGGKVPRIGKRAQVELRIPLGPKEISDICIRLRQLGFLEDESATHYELKNWQRYVGKYQQSSRKSRKKAAQKKQQNAAKSRGYGGASRAGALPSLQKEGQENGRESPRGASFSPSQEYPEKVKEMMRKHKEEKQK